MRTEKGRMGDFPLVGVMGQHPHSFATLHTHTHTCDSVFVNPLQKPSGRLFSSTYAANSIAVLKLSNTTAVVVKSQKTG